MFSLPVLQLDFIMQAETRIFLPVFRESGVRGGFGQALRRLVCTKTPDYRCQRCDRSSNCPFSVVFNPSHMADGFLANHEAIPTPFTLRLLSEQTTLNPGDTFGVRINLIGRAADYYPHVYIAIRELGRMGFGRKLEGQRGKYTLAPSAHASLDKPLKLDVGRFFNDQNADLPARFKVVFHTPVRLKKDRKLQDRPTLDLLVRSIVHRLNTFITYYGQGECITGVNDLLETAQNIAIIEDKTVFTDYTYYSRRQEQRLKLGGLVGEVVYEGPWAKLYPYLKAGELIGVGKNTSFGFGVISLTY